LTVFALCILAIWLQVEALRSPAPMTERLRLMLIAMVIALAATVVALVHLIALTL